MPRRAVVFSLVALVIAAALPVQEADAQGTNKPWRIVVGGPPGNPGDLAARAVADGLAQVLEQSVIVENRPGAMGAIALAAVARSGEDARTLAIVGMPATIAPHLIRPAPYDLLRDFTALRQIASLDLVLVVRAGSERASLTRLIDAARAAPDTITFTSGGNATPAHVAGVLFSREAKLALRHIPFNGAPRAVEAVLGGTVDMMIAAAPAVMGHIRAGRMLAIATTAPARMRALPDVPTLAESGYGDLVVRDWHGLVAPRSMRATEVERLRRAIDAVMLRPEVRERLAAIGMEAALESDAASFQALLESELRRWGRLVVESGLRAD